jgi:hypothetical protein
VDLITTNKKFNEISVRPGVQVLGIFQYLNYKSWHALAEFVDNSLQSYLVHRDRLKELHGDDFRLKVDIEIEDLDSGRIIVRDNAAGIAATDYQRAFRPAEAPPDRAGLSEFGMGMKSAACWFGAKWRVRTKALGESEAAIVDVDVNGIIASGIEHIRVRTEPAPLDQHFTELVIESLHQVPRKRGIYKIRTHLADIYRVFLRRGELELTLNGDVISFSDLPILSYPRFDAPKGAPEIVWRKEINLKTSTGASVSGFAGLLAVGKSSAAGFALFRRDRLIQGLTEEGWKPEEIFGRPNSFRSQRVFGELVIEGVAVSHTKDGFRLEAHEEELIPLLKDALDAEPLPLLEQAERMRVRLPKADLVQIATGGADATIAAVERHGPEHLDVVDDRSKQAVVSAEHFDLAQVSPAIMGYETSATGKQVDVAEPAFVARRESRTIKVHDEDWQVIMELTDDPAVTDWVKVAESLDVRERSIAIRFSLCHPFTQRFVTQDTNTLEPLLRVACAIGLAQVFARRAGVPKPGVVLMGMNDLLREVLCHD